jgi:hypothetical protein
MRSRSAGAGGLTSFDGCWPKNNFRVDLLGFHALGRDEPVLAEIEKAARPELNVVL